MLGGGRGSKDADNSAQHWMTSCPCLGLAGSLLLAIHFLVSAVTLAERCYALYSGARAVIRQRGGLVAKQGDPPALASVDVIHACLVATCSHEFLPTDVRRGARPEWLLGPAAQRSCLECASCIRCWLPSPRHCATPATLRLPGRHACHVWLTRYCPS